MSPAGSRYEHSLSGKCVGARTRPNFLLMVRHKMLAGPRTFENRCKKYLGAYVRSGTKIGVELPRFPFVKLA